MSITTPPTDGTRAAIIDADGKLTAIIRMDLEAFIDGDREGVLDQMESAVTDATLSGIGYTVVDFDGTFLLLEITGTVNNDGDLAAAKPLAYSYQDDRFTGPQLLEQMELTGTDAEEALDALAVTLGVNRADQSTFDDIDFPKVLTVDQLVKEDYEWMGWAYSFVRFAGPDSPISDVLLREGPFAGSLVSYDD